MNESFMGLTYSGKENEGKSHHIGEKLFRKRYSGEMNCNGPQPGLLIIQ